MGARADYLCTHATPKRTSCKSCRAPIFYAVLAKTRETIPLDIRPDRDEGTVLWPWALAEDDTLLGYVLTKTERPTFQSPGFRLFVPHFATCPDADQHRKVSA